MPGHAQAIESDRGCKDASSDEDAGAGAGRPSMDSSQSAHAEVAHGDALAHAPRLARASVELIEERVEALEQHKLAPAPEKALARPLKSLLKNVWVLALMAGVLSIIIVAKNRIHVAEPLAGVHATNGVVPYILPLENSYVDYLYINLLIAPFFPPDSESGDGHRRRLAAWVGEAVSGRHNSAAAGGSAQPVDGGPYVGAAADAELVRRVKKLLARPQLTLAQRRRNVHRRLLTAEGLQEPANETGDGQQLDDVDDVPQLTVTLMQLNATAAAALSSDAALAGDMSANAGATSAEGLPQMFYPVSEPQLCTTKEGAAVKCSLAFRSSDLTDDVVQGQALYLAFASSQITQVVFKAEVSELGGLGPVKNWLALGILLAVLVGIASERIHRMWCAMIGAAFMMSLLLWMEFTPSLALVVEWLDESTLGLLFGMMIIVGRLKDTGFFELVSAWTVRISKGRMWVLSLMLMVATAFISAFLDNVTTMLLMGPVTISMMRQCNRDPVPLLMAQVLMSNIGGAATMVGDPPALIIGTALSNYIGFVDFIVNMSPGVIMAAAACIPLILLIYRRTLMGAVQGYDKVLQEVAAFRIRDWDLMAKCSYVTAVVLVGFLLHPVHHVDPAWFAVLGAVVLCVCDQPMEVEKVVHSVEWDMLLFFAAMFVMIEAAAEVGMISMIAGWLESAIRSAPESSRLIIAIQILLWVSAVISGVLDNIPYTIVMVPVIEYLAAAGLGLELPTLAWALNFGACFGGNATLIGASANIVTATLAERAGEKVAFLSWLKSGIPVTLASVAMADLWMILRFCL